MNNEARAREDIDKMLVDCGWVVQDYKMMDLGDSENLPDPKLLALEIAEDLESALDEFKRIYEELEE